MRTFRLQLKSERTDMKKGKPAVEAVNVRADDL